MPPVTSSPGSLNAVGEPGKRARISRAMSVTAIVAVVAAGGVGVAAAAYAASPAIPGRDGVIRVCVEADDVGHYNDLRFLINGAKFCKRGEKVIWWNHRGRTGKTGAKGATGPKGDPGVKGDTGTPGVSGFEIVESAEVQAPGFSSGEAVATCPAGKVAIGGGFRSTDTNVIVMDSSPRTTLPDERTWFVVAYNSGAGLSGPFKAYATCATVG